MYLFINVFITMFFRKKDECETTTKNNNILVWVIVVLAIVIAVMWFFLGKMTSWNGWVSTGNYDDLTIKVIKDARDSTFDTDTVLKEMKLLPSISNAEIEVVDFSDKGVKEFLQENKIDTLPAFIFNTNNFDVSADPVQMGQDGQPAPKINGFLQKLPNGEFYLEIGATYDPFVERSDRGFRMLTKEQLESIKKDVYVKGNADAKITWLEYSDLECPYCAKLHATDGTPKTVTEKYGDELNIIFNHFPLYFHNNAQAAAEILECVGSQKWSDAFYSLIETSFTSANSTKDYLIDEAVKLWADKTKLNKCLDDKTFAKKTADQMQAGTDIFGVTWTPGNVLINNETLEYEVLSGAYPAASFIEIIDKLK